jgi:hypothetical protein
MPTQCQTPAAVFHIAISDRSVSAVVDLPHSLDLSDDAATLLEANVHNALELALAPYFGQRRP